MFRFHTLLRAELHGTTLVIIPTAGGIGFRYVDLHTELNRLLRVFDDPSKETPHNLVVDLGRLDYYGQEFLGAVITILNRASQGGNAVWCNASPELQGVLVEMGVSTLWPYFHTLDDALAWVNAPLSDTPADPQTPGG